MKKIFNPEDNIEKELCEAMGIAFEGIDEKSETQVSEINQKVPSTSIVGDVTDNQAAGEAVEEPAPLPDMKVILSDLIKDEWEAIAGYQKAIEVATGSDMAKNLIDIKEEELVHVGQLQKLLDGISLEVSEKIEEGEQEASKESTPDPLEEPAEEAVEGNNLKAFMDEAHKVSDWYESFGEDQEKIEGPGSIVGMEFWDGGDDIDYIRSAILGFEEYSDPFENGQDYLNYFKEAGYLTDNSSEEWKQKITHLSELFNRLTPEEKEEIPEEFGFEGEDDGDEGEESETTDYRELNIAGIEKATKYYEEKYEELMKDPNASEEEKQEIKQIIEENKKELKWLLDHPES